MTPSTTFDQKFDSGESVVELLDMSKATRPGLRQQDQLNASSDAAACVTPATSGLVPVILAEPLDEAPHTDLD